MFLSAFNKREIFNKLIRHRTKTKWLVIKGDSMSPFLLDGQYVSLDTDKKILQSIPRGAIIAFNNPEISTKVLIKRIIGLPGESIEVENRQLMINGSLLKENYLTNLPNYIGEVSVKLDSEEFFVLGDNPQDSMDSRKFGAIHISDILGVVWFRLWPPTQF
ncbi:MAG: signal peptidase I [Candidatus Hodarchaeales archaeon]|jgi:signal peptidase I